MPTYEYKCTNDGSVFELWQEVGAEAPACPTCGAATKKVFQPTRTIFKGSGFYITDKRSESGTGSSAKSESEAPAPATETKSEAPASTAPASSATSGTGSAANTAKTT